MSASDVAMSRRAQHRVLGALVQAAAGGPRPAPLPPEPPAASRPAQVDVPMPACDPCFVLLLQLSASPCGAAGERAGDTVANTL